MIQNRSEWGYPVARFERTTLYNRGESWERVAYFDLDALELVDCEIDPDSPDFDSSELATELTGWERSYDGPGRRYVDEPYAKIQRNRNRIRVTQWGGYDI